MVQINKLNVKYNFKEIDNIFDFFIIQTDEKYIPRGAYLLDRPVLKLKALSLVFESGRSAFVMFKKDTIIARKLLEDIGDESISIKKVSSENIKDYILFRLFLYSLSNYNSDSMTFNNLTGKLYLFKSEWIKKNRKHFKCLQIDVDANLCIKANACSFNLLKLFKDKKAKLKEYPKYSFDGNNSTLCRVLNFDENDEIFIKKSLYNTKCEIPYFSLNKNDIDNTKISCIYNVLDLLEKKYANYLQFSFETINKISTIDQYKDELFIEKAKHIIKKSQINIVNFAEEEYEYLVDDITKLLKEKLDESIVKTSSKIVEKTFNLVLVHNKEYYKEKEVEDPHKEKHKNCVVQYFTVEDTLEKILKDNEAIINTILKEMVIKYDIIFGHKITLDSWENLSLTDDFIMGKDVDDYTYFIIIHPNGDIEFDYKEKIAEDYNRKILNDLVLELECSNNKEKTIISYKDNISILSRTNMYPMPVKEILSEQVISRSKLARDKFLNGVVDINLYEANHRFYFNAGLKGSGMNTALPKAPLLYNIEVLKGENFFEKLLLTLSVTFVKYKQFTVLPYPIKYLNEYIELVRVDNDK